MFHHKGKLTWSHTLGYVSRAMSLASPKEGALVSRFQTGSMWGDVYKKQMRKGNICCLWHLSVWVTQSVHLYKMNIPGGTLSLLASFVPGHHGVGGRQSGKAWMFRKPDKHFPRFVQRLCPRSLGNKNMGFGVRGLGLLLFKSRLCPLRQVIWLHYIWLSSPKKWELCCPPGRAAGNKL